MDYTQLDKATRLSAVQKRIKELENQHFMMSIRAEAPDLTQPPGGIDTSLLERLESSLNKLHQLEQELSVQ